MQVFLTGFISSYTNVRQLHSLKLKRKVILSKLNQFLRKYSLLLYFLIKLITIRI